MIIYRRKGQTEQADYEVEAGILVQRRDAILRFKPEGYPHGDIDLRGMPVISMRDSSRKMGRRLRAFLKEKPDFRGAFLMAPGTGNWDIGGSGTLLFTDREMAQRAGFDLSQLQPYFGESKDGRIIEGTWDTSGKLPRINELPWLAPWSIKRVVDINPAWFLVRPGRDIVYKQFEPGIFTEFGYTERIKGEHICFRLPSYQQKEIKANDPSELMRGQEPCYIVHVPPRPKKKG